MGQVRRVSPSSGRQSSGVARVMRAIAIAAVVACGIGVDLHAQLRARVHASGFTSADRVRAGSGRSGRPVRRAAERPHPRDSRRRRAAGGFHRSVGRHRVGRRAGTARARVSPGGARRAAGSSSTSPTAPATPSSRGCAARRIRWWPIPPRDSICDGAARRAGVHRAAVRQPQRRPSGVRSRRLSLHRARRRRLGQRSRIIARRIRPSCSARCCGSTSASPTPIRPATRCRPDNPFVRGGPAGRAAGDLELRAEEPVALFVRRSGARRHRRAHHRRRRAEPVRRDRLRAGQPRRAQLRLAQSRRRPRQRHVAPAGVSPARRSDPRVRPQRRAVGDRRLRLPRQRAAGVESAAATSSPISSRAACCRSRSRSTPAGEARASDLVEHTAELSNAGALGNVSSFGVDADGELYIVGYSTGRILKMIGPRRRAARADRPADYSIVTDAAPCQCCVTTRGTQSTQRIVETVLDCPRVSSVTSTPRSATTCAAQCVIA